MNFQEKIKGFKDKKRGYVQEYSNLSMAEREELSTLKYEIETKFMVLKNEVNHKSKILEEEILEYCSKLDKCVTFEANEIGPVIAEIVTALENEEYLYQGGVCYHITAFDYNRKINKTKTPSIIVAKARLCDFYLESGTRNLQAIINDGKAFVLTERGSNLDQKINFYQVDGWNCLLIPQVNFGYFSYINDFIDEVISYKMEHDFTLDQEELENLKKSFILSRSKENHTVSNLNKSQRLTLEM